jgi:hypothetical protein
MTPFFPLFAALALKDKAPGLPEAVISSSPAVPAAGRFVIAFSTIRDQARQVEQANKTISEQTKKRKALAVDISKLLIVNRLLNEVTKNPKEYPELVDLLMSVSQNDREALIALIGAVGKERKQSESKD